MINGTAQQQVPAPINTQYQATSNFPKMYPGVGDTLSNSSGEKYEWPSQGMAQKRQLWSGDEEVSFRGTNKVMN